MWRPDGPFVHDAAWWQSWQGALIVGLLILIAGLLTWLVLSSRREPERRAGGGRDEALDQARMRYARGELDRGGFAQVVLDLTGTPGAAEPATVPGATAPPATAPEAPTVDPKETPPDPAA